MINSTKKKNLITIDIWKSCIKNNNTKHLSEIISNEIVFFSPVVHTPQKGKELALKYLTTAIKILHKSNFSYIRQIYHTNQVILEFNCILGKIKVNGIDIIELDNDFKIKHFKVFIRPLKGLNTIWKKMETELIKY